MIYDIDNIRGYVWRSRIFHSYLSISTFSTGPKSQTVRSYLNFFAFPLRGCLENLSQHPAPLEGSTELVAKPGFSSITFELCILRRWVVSQNGQKYALLSDVSMMLQYLVPLLCCRINFPGLIAYLKLTRASSHPR